MQIHLSLIQAESIDADQDGTVDYVYAGDMKGNLYRFDLCRADLPAFSDWASSGLGTLPATYTGILGGCKKGVEIFAYDTRFTNEKTRTPHYQGTSQPLPCYISE